MATILISSDVPATVERVTGFDAYDNRSLMALACASTPCVVTLPYGDYELWFTGIADHQRTSQALLHVASDNVVLNHTLGQDRASSGPLIGLGLIVLGLAIAAGGEKAKSGPIEGLGVGVAIFGWFAGLLSPSVKQPGASTQWTPQPAERPPLGLSLRFRF